MHRASYPRIAADELTLAPLVENEPQEYKAIGGASEASRFDEIILLNQR